MDPTIVFPLEASSSPAMGMSVGSSGSRHILTTNLCYYSLITEDLQPQRPVGEHRTFQ